MAANVDELLAAEPFAPVTPPPAAPPVVLPPVELPVAVESTPAVVSSLLLRIIISSGVLGTPSAPHK
jgi:hypothetical protein